MSKMTFSFGLSTLHHKIERKGRTKEALHQVIEWLTCFDNRILQELIKEKRIFKTFFKKAKLNRNAHLITGLNESMCRPKGCPASTFQELIKSL